MNKQQIIAVAVSIAAGVIIRVIYDFAVKPRLKKKKLQITSKQLKALIKNSEESSADLKILLDYLESSDNPLLNKYCRELKPYLKKDLNEEEYESLSEKLKELKKLSK